MLLKYIKHINCLIKMKNRKKAICLTILITVFLINNYLLFILT